MTLSSQEIKNRRDHLLSIGLSEKTIEKIPQTKPPLYSKDTVNNTIQGLKDRGFANPEKMIATLPPVLNLSFENIDGKIKMLDKLINLYKLDFTPVEIIEVNYSIFSSKIDKLWVLARIIREHAESAGEVDNKLFRNLLFSNLESVVLASRTKEGLSLDEILAEAKIIKRDLPSPEEKRELISQLPESDLVKKRFERGYPPKNK